MSNSTTAAAAETVQDKDTKQQESLEKQYQKDKHVPEGWNRKLVTRNGETKPVYTRRESK